MGLSVGSIGNPYSMSFIKPLNYPVKNQASVSDAFLETGMQGAITNVPPVIYPNAQEVPKADEESNPLALSANVVQKSQEANKMYNEIAQKFQGMTIGYGQDSGGQTYAAAGSRLDLFA